MPCAWTTRASGLLFDPVAVDDDCNSTSITSEDSLRPRALVLVHVRAPPPNSLWDEARKRLLAPSLGTGGARRRAPNLSRDATEIYSTTCGATFYSSVVF